MTITYVLMQNLRRNPLRTALTTISFAFPMAVFVAAISFVVALVQMARANEQQLRLGVHHKRTVINPLPEGMRRKIEAMDPQRERLLAVCGMRWFGGRVPNTQNTLTSLAADPDTFPVVYSDLELTDADIEAWLHDRQAAIVGSGPARTYRWKEGQRITLESTIPPYIALEFNLIKILDQPERANYFYSRRDYLDEELKESGGQAGTCHIFWVKCQSAAALRSMQKEIDATFANSPDETKSEDENAFAANFTQAAGDIPGLMQVMALVVVFILALVGGNAMMMSFRERIGELAVFKAMGFQAWRIFSIVLGESVVLALVGAVVGIVPVTVLLTVAPVQGVNFGPISTLEVSPVAVVGSFAIAIAVGLAAGIWPALQAMRLDTVSALRKVA